MARRGARDIPGNDPGPPGAAQCRSLVWARACAVCKSVISQIDAQLTTKQREDVEEVEKVMRKWCDTSKGKDKTMCYYMGVGDAEQVRAR
jgi:hypothetical protein